MPIILSELRTQNSELRTQNSELRIAILSLDDYIKSKRPLCLGKRNFFRAGRSFCF